MSNLVRNVASSCLTRSSCCPLHLQFLQTLPGIIKIAQLTIGSACQTLLTNYITGYSQIIGYSYISLLMSASACVYTVTLLLFCYIISANTYGLIRSSIFEIVFNTAAAISYCTSSAFFLIAVKLYLYPLDMITLGFIAYKVMCTIYMMGFFLAFLHALDAFHSYKSHR